MPAKDLWKTGGGAEADAGRRHGLSGDRTRSSPPIARSIRRPAPSASARRSRIRNQLLRPGQYGRVSAEHAHVARTRCSCRSARSASSRAAPQIRVVGADDTVHVKTIKTGPRVGTRWVVTEGLSPGDRVIVDSGQPAEGTKVTTKPFDRRRAARAEATDMSAFFVRRPIVAIVIAIVTVLGGLVSLRALPVAQFPDIVPPQIIVTGTLQRRRRADHRAVGRHAARAADERRRQHALHAVDQRQRRVDAADGHVRHRHRPEHRSGERPEPRSRRRSRTCRATSPSTA